MRKKNSWLTPMRSLLPATGLASTALATYYTCGAGGSSLVSDKELDETGLFQVDVVTAPPAAGDFRAFTPDFGQCQVIVTNYDAPDGRWPEPLKTAFDSYVNGGGGLAVVHAAVSDDKAGRAGNHGKRREPSREIAL
jgi:hypothetical protein